jgi:hypothetical protein
MMLGAGMQAPTERGRCGRGEGGGAVGRREVCVWGWGGEVGEVGVWGGGGLVARPHLGVAQAAALWRARHLQRHRAVPRLQQGQQLFELRLGGGSSGGSGGGA